MSCRSSRLDFRGTLSGGVVEGALLHELAGAFQHVVLACRLSLHVGEGFGVEGLGLRVEELRVQGSGLRDLGLGF